MAIITTQELTDAATDAKTFEDVANGAVNLNGDGIVHPRTGGNLKTLAKIQSDIEASGTGILALSKDWASKSANSVVADGEYSAKHYAEKAAEEKAAAQAAADGIIWSKVKFLTHADSPYTATTANNGELLVVDTSGGAFILNLPTISTLSLPFNVAIKKDTGDTNIITVNRAGTDTIGSAETSKIIQNKGGVTFLADNTKTPDRWTSAIFGAFGINKSVDEFSAGVGFTGGTSTTITLTHDAGSENNTFVLFDNTPQLKSTYTLSGRVITFSSAIPSTVSKIEVTYGKGAEIGVPADSTVSFASLTTAAIATEAQAKTGTDSQSIMTPARTRDAVKGMTPYLLHEVRNFGAATSVVFTDIPDNIFIFGHYRQNSNNSHLAMQTSPDSGSSPTFDSGSSDYVYAGVNGLTEPYTASNFSKGFESNILVGGGLGANTAASGQFSLRGLWLHNAQFYTLFEGTQSGYVNDGSVWSGTVCGMRRSAGAVRALRFFELTNQSIFGQIWIYKIVS